MNGRAVKILAACSALTVVALFTMPAGATPLEPATMRQLARSADWVGIVDVLAITSGTGAASARVRVVERLAGPAATELEVSFTLAGHCPPPAFAPTDGRVLLFLDRVDHRWFPTHGRFSVRPVVDATSRAAVVERAREALALSPGAPRDVSEWALRCTRHPSTAWDGAYELAVDPAIRRALTADEVRCAPPGIPFPRRSRIPR